MNRHTRRLLAIGMLLAACIGYAPAAEPPAAAAPAAPAAAAPAAPAVTQVEVVFVLDSTGSMGGLIEGAKQKIWSIANSFIATKPAPQLKIGLISYRDRGDAYVTKFHDLTDDIDTVFSNLKGFRADGGGDGPESVNQALHEAVNKMSWSADRQVLKVIFLVGDFPPHMDYRDDVKYPVTCQVAVKRDLIINTVQCGSESSTTPVWQDIARLAEGSYVALAQSGGMVAVTTPFDADIAKVSTDLGKTMITYGKAEEQTVARGKVMAAAEAPASVAADRASFNLAKGGRAIQGGGDLLDALKDNQVSLDKLKSEDLSPEMRKMTPEQRTAYVAAQQKTREALNGQLTELAKKRADFIAAENKRLATEGKGDSFDQKVAEIVTEQAKRKK